MNVGLLNLLAAILYLVAAVLYCSAVIAAATTKMALRLTCGRVCALSAVILNTSAIGVHCVTTHHTPISSPASLLSATGWSVAIAYLIIELFLRNRRPTALGTLAFTLSFLAIFCGSVMSAQLPNSGDHRIDLDNAVISLHVTAILFGFACLMLAVFCSAIYLIEHKLLKEKRVAATLFGRLPPLSVLDSLSYGLVSFAFPLLSIGMLAGAFRAITMHLAFADMHTAMSIVTWALMLAYLLAHASSIGKGVRANYLLLLCLASALITYMIQNQMHHFA